jgi:hypothetical protein
VIAAPPFDAGAVHDTTDWALALEVPATAVGAPGVVEGVATADALEYAPVPFVFAAATWNS